MTSVLIVTGLSGAGKSTVLHALEDLGWFSMDNLPAPLLPRVLELAGTQEPIDRVAVGIDARDQSFIAGAGDVIDRLRSSGIALQVLYVDANDEALIQRFSATRRRHPLDGQGALASAISAERQVLAAMRARADMLIDTSELHVSELQQLIRESFSGGLDVRMRIRLVSFGFKHGITPEADLVFDVRFLTNPFLEPELRDRNGLDDDVRSYVQQQDSAQRFRAMVLELLRFLLPRYEESGKAYLTVAIGCTGGQHRSVAMVESLAEELRTEGWKPTVAHREAHRWPNEEQRNG